MIKNHVRKTIALLSFIITLIIAFPALSDTVFGPKQYTRTRGAPNTYTDTFQSMGGPEALSSETEKLRVPTEVGELATITA